jgi:hypothetical protein
MNYGITFHSYNFILKYYFSMVMSLLETFIWLESSNKDAFSGSASHCEPIVDLLEFICM